ncbi:PREDICTED: uncharacterized protein LOC108559633 isoform X2 [Nicrophorus vespilloides]|uniref:Uncharacterized protein LOC108559633 isoform X2 n=1 Tax=Nicrophorus vespilloides TaxID=110193 RepID=A0ABM1MD18_NICVS|nr:PREDICTED: uncharacterized protein LOC108559633 isoform X2 [Nicrophorus vespilloides]
MVMEAENSFIDAVVDLYRAKDWRSIVLLNEHSNNEAALRLLWVWPSLENVEFIRRTLCESNLSGMISIGCGCGLLEWILQEATGFKVFGIEVNEEWWISKYSNPKFIPHLYPTAEEPNPVLNPNFALLFCYFNDGQAFKEYVDRYEGCLIVIIGPGEGRGTHTDPEPFKPDFGIYSRWNLLSFQELLLK